MTTVTARGTDHRDLALRKANKIRVHTASVKRQLRTGSLTLEEALRRVDELPAGVTLLDLLPHLPRFGPERLVTLNALAIEHRINLAMPVGRTSRATRQWLVEAVRGTVEPVPPAPAPAEPAPMAPVTRLVFTREPDGRATALAQLIAWHGRAIRGLIPGAAFIADERLYAGTKAIMAGDTVDELAA